MAVIMGTAGHIDHGKTSLIKALTGIDCDRLAEEKKRGITIELGFAFLDLPGGARLGVVDVPGHERFVKNMVAGAAGIDFVLLVVAADEGIMPQTREHLEICSLLGIETGIVALTKTDMVEEDWLEMVTEEVGNYLEPTFLGGAPIVPVSAHTGQGLDELRDELSKLVGEYAPKRRSDLFRLPVDRIFTMKGFGTVVTGTMISGQAAVGDDVLVYPKGTATKIRSLQSHGDQVEKADAGRRTAINLHGLEVEDLERGAVLARPGSLFPALVWDLELSCLKSAPKSLKHRKEIHFHHGAKETLARIYLLDREELKQGETAICQVRFESPLAGVYGDRVVIRSFSPLQTIAGGRIVNPHGRKVKRFSDGLSLLRRLVAEEAEELAEAQLELAGSEGVTFDELLTMTNVESKGLEKMLQVLGGQQKAFVFHKDERLYVSGKVADELSESMLASLSGYHEKNPMKQGVAKGELASTWGRKLSPRLFHFLLERLLKKGDIVSEQETIRLPGHKVSLASDQAKLRETILGAYVAGGETPPNLKDVLKDLNLSFSEAAPVFKLLQEEGLLVKIKEEMYFSSEAVKSVTDKVVGFLRENNEMGAPDFKTLTGLSRKFAIPLLEYLDKEKITVRVGDVRRLRKA